MKKMPFPLKPGKAKPGKPKMNPAPASGKGKPFKSGGYAKGKC